MSSAHPLIGVCLDGRYVIQELIGSGGMGSVYLALDQTLDRPVAVKVLKTGSDSAQRRFERECQALAAVQSEHIPAIYAWGWLSPGIPYLVMERVVGETLDRRLETDKTMAPDLVRAITMQVCDALAVIHEHGMVHRDLKPSNIVLAERDHELLVMVMDFGIVHLCDADQALTGTSEVIGSVFYMSPEHLIPKLLQPRSDIFSLGCIMYECLMGNPPYQDENAMASLIRLQDGKHKALSADVPAYLIYAVEKCLAPDPGRRFASTQKLKDVLATMTTTGSFHLQTTPRFFLARWRGLALALAGLVLGVIVCLCLELPRAPRNFDQGALPERVRSAVKAGNLDDERLVIRYLSGRPRGFWLGCPASVWDDLNHIASNMLDAGDRASADRVFNVCLEGAQLRGREPLEICRILREKVRLYRQHRIVDRTVLRDCLDSVEWAKKSGQEGEVSWSEYTLASAYQVSGNNTEANRIYRELADIDDPARAWMSALSALNYAQWLQSAKVYDPDEVRYLALAADRFCVHLDQSGSEAFYSYLLQLGELTTRIPVRYRTKACLAKVDRALRLAAKEGVPDQVLPMLTFMRLEVERLYDPAMVKPTLRTLIEVSRQAGNWHLLQVGIYALDDADGIKSRSERSSLLSEAYRRSVHDADARLGVILAYRAAQAYFDEGQFQEARPYCLAAIERVSAYRKKSTQAVQRDQDVRSILRDLESFASRLHWPELAKRVELEESALKDGQP